MIETNVNNQNKFLKKPCQVKYREFQTFFSFSYMHGIRGILSQSAQGAITEYHRLGSLNNRHLHTSGGYI